MEWCPCSCTNKTKSNCQLLAMWQIAHSLCSSSTSCNRQWVSSMYPASFICKVHLPKQHISLVFVSEFCLLPQKCVPSFQPQPSNSQSPFWYLSPSLYFPHVLHYPTCQLQHRYVKVSHTLQHSLGLTSDNDLQHIQLTPHCHKSYKHPAKFPKFQRLLQSGFFWWSPLLDVDALHGQKGPLCNHNVHLLV